MSKFPLLNGAGSTIFTASCPGRQVVSLDFPPEFAERFDDLGALVLLSSSSVRELAVWLNLYADEADNL